MRSWTRGIAAVLAFAVLALAGCTGSGSQKEVALNFYFPIAVGGPLQAKVDAMVADFTKANPNIKVTAVYAGNYQDTMTKVQAAKPEVAVLQATDIFTLTDMDLIVPIDDYLAKDKDGKAYMDDMVPAFMGNSRLNNKTWSVPFQRSTVVMYYNKDLFKAAGLDPNKAPANWDQLNSAPPSASTAPKSPRAWISSWPSPRPTRSCRPASSSGVTCPTISWPARPR
ncbi:MAG: transporter substrate-binding protein [Symbiobacteriaceae bacterium]|nr:transporter substrate-binding protein [Symbiobacteriaceae bacterium]